MKLIKKKIKKIYILNFNIFNIVFQFIKLRRIIKKENPDILHCFMPHANLIGRFAAINLNCINISSIRVKLIKKKYLNILDLITQGLVNKYLVNSKVLNNFITMYGIRQKKITLIENGVDFKNFKPTRKPKEIREELNLPDITIITMIANLRKQKDYPTMHRALKYLQQDHDFCFLSVGSGSIYENETYKIKKMIQKLKLKNVKLCGYREDIPNILTITDIWVSSTLYEGQSNSLLEAMAMKKPIITTNIPENREVVKNLKEAILVPTRSPKKIPDAIKLLIENKDLSIKIANNAYKKALNEYNFENQIKKYTEFYQILMQRK